MSIPTSPNLGNIITNPTARKVIYGAYGIFAFIVACVQVGFAAAQAGQPVWLTVTLAVTAFAGGTIGLLATANTPSDKPGDHA